MSARVLIAKRWPTPVGKFKEKLRKGLITIMWSVFKEA